MSSPQIKTTVGETMRWAGTWSAAGVAVNLTGYVLTTEVRKPIDPTYLEEVAVTLGDQGTSPGSYTVDVSSLDLPAGSYQVRLKITEPDADVYRSTPIGLLVEAP